MTVAAKRRPKKYRTREMTVAAKRRRPKKHHAREMTVATKRRPKHRVRSNRVRANGYGGMMRTAGEMALEVGTSLFGYLLADGIDRFLATYDPAAAAKPANKFTSDGTGTLANALNVASPPDMWRWGSLGALTVLPLGGSLLIKHPALRSSIEGIGIGAGIKLASTVWSTVLMPLLVGKDTSVPALQKNWIARLYPAEVSATLNIKSGKAAVSSGGANSTAGTLSGGSDRQLGTGDVGPFALAGRFDKIVRAWVAPPQWPQTAVPAAPPSPAGIPSPPTGQVPSPPTGQVRPAPPWPPHFREHHRHGMRSVGDAVQDMTHTIAAQTGVHPAHAVNAAMHAAAEPHDLTQALERALPHVHREVLRETARHLHPHVARMHAHARYPREHDAWIAARAAEGVAPPELDAPEHEWREWHQERAEAGLPPAPPPPEPPPASAPTPAYLRTREEWRPNYNREITADRYPTVQQVLGIGGFGGYPGQPGLGEVFSHAVQTVAASVPDVPLENAVNATAYAAAEPCNLVRALERALPQIRRALAEHCAEQVEPHIQRLHEQAGVPLPSAAPAAPAAVVPATPAAPAAPAPSITVFVPSPPPPSWTRSESEWHDQEKRDWDRARSSAPAAPAVTAAATQAAQAAAAPHADANHPTVAAAVNAAATGAAQAASAAAPGTPAPVVAQAAKAGAQAAADAHGAAADHPAVQAAIAAAAPAAASAAAAPKSGVAGLASPPRNLQIGPTKLPHPGGPQSLDKECGCLDDSPYLGFIGDEQESDLMFNLND